MRLEPFLKSLATVSVLLSAIHPWTGAFAHQDNLPSSASLPVITYCVDPDWMPYEAITNGKHVGLSADYVRLISEHAGLNFQLLTTDSWDESLRALQRGDCQVASMLNSTPERARFLDFSDVYFEAANVFVTDSSTPFLQGYSNLGTHLLGVVTNYRHAEYVRKYYPELNIREVSSESEGLLKLANGELDVFVGSAMSATHYLNSYNLTDLRIAGLAEPHDKLRMGVLKGQQELLDKINGGIRAIDESQHVEIFKQWNSVKTIQEVDYTVLAMMLTIFLVIICVIIWRNQYVTRFNHMLLAKNTLLESLQDQLLEKNRTLEYMSTHDQLTNLHNRHYMIRRCEQEIQRMQRFNQSSCFILLDIDNFKDINDKFGHTTGDNVLQELTEICNENIREIDVMCRWGGEEFLILCPQTNMTESNSLAVRLGKAINSASFSGVDKMSCSFGIAQFNENNTFGEWFDRADAALYQAKTAGRNRIFISE